MKFAIALAAMCAVCILVSDVSAQGGSAGRRGVTVKSYTVMKPVAVTEYVPRTRLVWQPRTIAVASYGSHGGRAASYGSNGGRAAGYGSNGGYAFARARLFTGRVAYLAWTPIRALGGSNGKVNHASRH